MKTEVLSIEHPQAIQRALELLRAGRLVAFPTDTVYGLAALVTDRQAIDLIFQAKERSPSKAIAVLIGEISQLSLVTPGLSTAALRLAARFWPGALTLVVTSLPGLPDNLSPTPTIGVRMPDHAFTRRLLTQSGPLATTSANLSGGPNPRNAQEVLNQLEGRVALVLDGGDSAGGVPSTVVDCTAAKLTILREGAISASEIAGLLNQ
jgi:L-threonylcarbamoyladenylate synthase